MLDIAFSKPAAPKAGAVALLLAEEEDMTGAALALNEAAGGALIRAMARASGRPIHLNTLTSMPHAPDGWSRSLEFAREAAAEGLAVHPMFASNRQGAHFSLDTTFLFDEMPSFRDTLTLPEPQRSERRRVTS